MTWHKNSQGQVIWGNVVKFSRVVKPSGRRIKDEISASPFVNRLGP